MRLVFLFPILFHQFVIAQVDPFGLPPMESGLMGSSLMHPSEGSSALPTPSATPDKLNGLFRQSWLLPEAGLSVLEFRCFGQFRELFYSGDLTQIGWSDQRRTRARVGLSLPVNRLRLGARWSLEQWFPSENQQPFRIYPEIALWGSLHSDWSFALSCVNPLEVRWLTTKVRSERTMQFEMQHRIWSENTLHLGWKNNGLENRWSAGAHWRLNNQFELTTGCGTGSNWMAVGWLVRWKSWAFHGVLEMGRLKGWTYGIACSWRSS